jgi:chemotaxis protein CheX
MKLSETLDLAAADGLKSALLERRGTALALDASDVRRLGGLCLQVLLAAKATWDADGEAFDIADPSEAFLEAVRLSGAAGRLSIGEGVGEDA